MIRLALDGTPLLGPRTGIGEVVAGLTAGLAVRSDLEVTAYALTWRGRHDLGGVVPAGVRAATAPIPARFARQAWLRAEHPRIERWTGPVDVVHSTNYVGPPTRARSVVSVYDLGFVRFPELCTADALQYPRAARTCHRARRVDPRDERLGGVRDHRDVRGAGRACRARLPGRARDRGRRRRRRAARRGRRALRAVRRARSSPARTSPSSCARSTRSPTTTPTSRS